MEEATTGDSLSFEQNWPTVLRSAVSQPYTWSRCSVRRRPPSPCSAAPTLLAVKFTSAIPR